MRDGLVDHAATSGGRNIVGSGIREVKGFKQIVTQFDKHSCVRRCSCRDSRSGQPPPAGTSHTYTIRKPESDPPTFFALTGRILIRKARRQSTVTARWAVEDTSPNLRAMLPSSPRSREASLR